MYSLNTLSSASGAVAIAVVLYLVLSHVRALVAFKHRQRGRPFPSGPRPLPLIGNLLDLPLTKQGIGLRDLCRKYGEYPVFVPFTSILTATGDVVYMNVCGQPILVTGNVAVTKELLETRSANTSDRHYSIVLDL